MQIAFKRIFSFSPPLFYGRGIFQYSIGLLPYRRPIVTVIGAPIRVPRVPMPTHEQVDQLHAEYCRRLSELFDAHKTKYGIPAEKHLEFVPEKWDSSELYIHITANPVIE